MSARPVATVAVVGTGVIGTSWAVHFLAQGLSVIATDVAPGAEERFQADLARLLPVVENLQVGRGASTERVRFTPVLAEAAAVADFIQENTTEDLTAKQRLIAELDAAADLNVIIASSSSALTPSSLQELCARAPERVLVAHPFDPPHLVPLVEVVGGSQTTDSYIEAAIDFYRSAGKYPVRLRKEVLGHIANRLQAALWREAYSLVDRGVASVADIDVAIASGPGLRWASHGPFVNLALSAGPGGMDSMHKHLGPTISALWNDLGDPGLTKELVEQINAETTKLICELGGEQVREERDSWLAELAKRRL
ncbi:3-hydroxyacyl-CoA dehydrogenase NAD-binding domain-containing protein [Rhodoglobus vestalii]|uniref:3-hydroxyacyl-CoA dehydrogenase NAD-binding domain-containing protein n=1 Tax=Rhodoglobus vestalii TaxID=193384 RepID=UPI001C00EEEB|nr:3-hydroxyacyl-CoA dehydrogenase NAD-binding domain-containing protein [Rhodoglobus vestalii]